MTPRFLENKTHLLKDERGFTLIEVLIAAIVLAVLVLTVFIGIMYAEKQSVMNHQYRAATNVASSELERQYFYNRYNLDQTTQRTKAFTNRSVFLADLDEDNKLMGRLSVTVEDKLEVYGNQYYPYKRVYSTVEWEYPTPRDKHKIVLQEDHYPR
jgi:prepilin-type N-terminal cleavage/methylation domain-containing protein